MAGSRHAARRPGASRSTAVRRRTRGRHGQRATGRGQGGQERTRAAQPGAASAAHQRRARMPTHTQGGAKTHLCTGPGTRPRARRPAPAAASRTAARPSRSWSSRCHRSTAAAGARRGGRAGAGAGEMGRARPCRHMSASGMCTRVPRKCAVQLTRKSDVLLMRASRMSGSGETCCSHAGRSGDCGAHGHMRQCWC